MNAIVVDIEANNIYPFQTQIWTIVLKRVGGETVLLNPFRSTPSEIKKQFLSFVFKLENPIIIGHNYLGFDGWVLWKNFNLKMHVGKDTICGRQVQFFDTLFASQFLNPDREGKHSLESWGERLGYHKINYRQVALDAGIIAAHENEFCRWSKEMDVYCERDTELTEKIFILLYEQIISENSMNAFRLGQKTFYLMNAQAFTGFKFDIKAAEKLKVQIEKMIADLRAEVEPNLPKRKLKKSEKSFYQIPSKPYLKNQQFSTVMSSFLLRHNARVVSENIIEINGKRISVVPGTPIIDGLPMELDDQKELKEYFLSQGWIPSMWNYQKDEKGKPKRDKKGFIKTSPKIQENGKICPNLLELDGDLPKRIVRFLSLRNRLSVLTGWLEDPRLKWDGRLSAGATGIAATHRQKHTIVVNVPKAQEDVLLGREFRSLFTVDSGNKLIGVDQAALEARCEAHWTYPIDNGARANILISKDIHSHNAKIFFPTETKDFDIDSPDFNKEHPDFKPFRSLAKNGGYCLPMHTEILTDKGWSQYNDLMIGDTILSYNTLTGKIVTDKILEKHFLPSQEVIRYYNSFFSFQCTPDHRWYGWKRDWQGNMKFKFFTMSDSDSDHNILTAAEYQGGNSNVNVLEAELIGWILSEGTIRWAPKSNGRSTSGGKKRGVQISLAQSEHYFANEIRQLLAELDCDYSERTKNYNNGKHLVTFQIKSVWGRDFWDRVVGHRDSKHNIDWIQWMLNLTSDSRKAMLRAFWMGDGQVRTSRPTNSLFLSQNDGKISDMIQLAYFLEGRNVSLRKQISNSTCRTINVSPRGHVTLQRIVSTSLGKQDTFCLTTHNGTFIIRQNRTMMITGNCLSYGGQAPKLATTLRKPESEGKLLYEAYWKANPSLKSLKDKVEHEWEIKGNKKWIIGIDGRKLHSRSKHSLVNLLFQSTGAIIVDYAVCLFDMKMGGLELDSLGRPYYRYKNFIVKRVQYFHDEYGVEASQEISEEISKIMEWTMTEAGVRLKLNVPLVGQARIGNNWKETH